MPHIFYINRHLTQSWLVRCRNFHGWNNLRVPQVLVMVKITIVSNQRPWYITHTWVLYTRKAARFLEIPPDILNDVTWADSESPITKFTIKKNMQLCNQYCTWWCLAASLGVMTFVNRRITKCIYGNCTWMLNYLYSWLNLLQLQNS